MASATVQRWALRNPPNNTPRKRSSSNSATTAAERVAERSFDRKPVADKSALKLLAPVTSVRVATTASEAKPRANPPANLRHWPEILGRQAADQESMPRLRKKGHIPSKARPSRQRFR